MLSLPPEIQLTAEGDNLRLLLPTRPKSPARLVGCLPLGFGLLFAGFAVIWMLGAAGAFAPHAAPPAPVGPEAPAGGAGGGAGGAHHGFPWAGLLFMLFGVPFVFAGLKITAAGLAILVPGRAQIALAWETLRATRVVGALRFRRSRAIARVRALRVVTSSTRRPDWPALGRLVADCGESKPFVLAEDYAPDMLQAVANYLAEAIERRKLPQLEPGGVVAPKVAVVLEQQPPPAPPEPSPDAAETAPAEALAKPANSRIVCMPASDSVTLVVPRTGFRGAALFFLFFSLFWNGITGLVGGVFVWQFIRHPGLEGLMVMAFLSLFVAIGVAMLLAGIQAAFRKAVIVATRDSLVISQTGPIRNSERQWPASEIASIRTGDSGTKINDRALKELQVRTKDGTKTGYFDGRDDAELAWLAATLRTFYGLHRG